MIILQTHHLSKSFVIESILSDINIQIQSNDRIGIVGVNGAGKSTLLKILAGIMLPDQGEIQIAKGVQIGYLSQESGLDIENTIWNEMLKVFAGFKTKENDLRSLEQKMAEPKILNNAKEYEKLMKEYATLMEVFQEEGGYSYEAKIRGVLHGLGFQSYNYEKQYIHTLSGGEKTRLAMAKLLLESPDLLILDEPTNYLDVETLTWLEGYLKNYPGAITVVSHDRYFLDKLVTSIYEIEQTKAKKYPGNYTKYMITKAKQIEQMTKKYEKQQEEINKMEEFIQKNIVRASTTKRAQSKRKQLDKLDVIQKPTDYKKAASLSFESEVESGNNVLMVKDLSISFDKNMIFQNVSFEVTKKERIALVGPNGIGKSTLLKLITKDVFPDSGVINSGSNVKISFYNQEREDLQYDKTIIDEVWDDYPGLDEREVRTVLGSFLFSGDDVFKQIKDLSGGEKARVSLAKLMLNKANFLLLDEPTNHLDIYSREVLEKALVDFSGTIMFVSHDRYFLNQISTRTLELSSNGVTSYLGNYDYYLEKKSELEEDEANQTSKDSVTEKTNKEQYVEERKKQNQIKQLMRKAKQLEEQIEDIENKISDIEAELLKPEIYSDHQLTYEKNEELNTAKAKLEALLNDWEIAQEELES